MNFINDIFLFVLSVDKNKIINGLDFNELVERYFEKKKEKKEKKENILIFMMRCNFGKFWNIISITGKYKLIQMVIIDLNINNYDICSLISILDKIIKYSDNVNLIYHVINFYDVDETNAKNIIMGKNYEYDDKQEVYNFRHNICMFWLGLDNQRKLKFINLVEIFFTKLNPNEFNIIFEKKLPYNNYTIDLFDSSKNNVIQITNYDQLTNIVDNIHKQKNKSTIIDTIIFQQINLSKYDFTNIPLQIKKIKIIKCEIESIDMLHEGIEIINCNGNYIDKIDNLPRGVKVLICSNNKLTSLNNLPEGLEYLDCHTNIITQLDNLPKSLKYLYCNYNKIESIDYLPDNLIELDCSKNIIKNYSKLPENLVIMNIKGNKLTLLDKLPYGLNQLNISNNPISNIFSLNANLEKIIIGDDKYSSLTIKIFDLPNMLVSLLGGILNPKFENLYHQLINNNYENLTK